ncbi:DEAD-domain-containing protein [Aulographum hederae CBS 113979]|uniref:ATP-dependent RNA helicase n=1 Tax=Aulographum hederae CBS 113979 TaxID=1176131 RepID=A0A6G1GVX1_9PEZI|nr:DEAD-domain-containing protein [Aulographum hederae CBS 113979]
MADDGMLLNFSVPDSLKAPSAKVTGGAWRERKRAQKAANRSKPRAPGNANSTQIGDRRHALRDGYGVANEEDYEYIIPSKRQRLDDDRPASPQERTTSQPSHPTYRPKSQTQSNGTPKQIVSSLFTYNPKSTNQAKERGEENADPIEPSNAPLTDEMATFVSLGLSIPLAAHLIKKMAVNAPTAIQKAAITQLLQEDTDAFIQAETGSGKTLAYLLPIVQRIMALSTPTDGEVKDMSDKVHRDSGLFAIILAPTRELSKQIAVVLEGLLGCANWIVPGIVIGGEKKKSEKARLRKGLNILVATPGRLADHLEHTEALDVSNVRWLVLDEGDRLMELGFEEELQKIISVLNLRMKSKKPGSVANPRLPAKRTTVLCSATMKMDVEKLGQISLKDAAHIQADLAEKRLEGETTEEDAFSAPAQLKQSYAVVPAKMRLVTLAAVLKRAFSRKGAVMKTIVFIACADAVDFHFSALIRPEDDPVDSNSSDAEAGVITTKIPKSTKATSSSSLADTLTSAPSPSLSSPDNEIKAFRLHGSLPQSSRTSTLQAFSKSTTPSVLLCTDVASRGLDLPNVDFVIEYDPAFSRDEHLHRIGRTARAGRDGRAMVFLMPGCEEGYVEILRQGRRDAGVHITSHDANDLLKRGFERAGPSSRSGHTGVVKAVGGREWETRATDFQLGVERWVLASPVVLERARRGFQSWVRAYATHISAERRFFDIKALHLGHLAKAFGLRDRPGEIRVPGMRPGKDQHKEGRGKGTKRSGGDGDGMDEDDGVPEITDAEQAKRLMRAKARMNMSGASEFNLG